MAFHKGSEARVSEISQNLVLAVENLLLAMQKSCPECMRDSFLAPVIESMPDSGAVIVRWLIQEIPVSAVFFLGYSGREEPDVYSTVLAEYKNNGEPVVLCDNFRCTADNVFQIVAFIFQAVQEN